MTGGGIMFDLEKAIRDWKKALSKYEVFEDGAIADIELHLRDEFDTQKKAGLDDEAAFQAAVAQVGTAESLSSEYNKNRLVKLDRHSPLRPGRFMPALFWNFIKIVLRKIKRQKGYSFINITGLAIGIACCIVMVLYIHSELSFDTFHEKADRIYTLGVQSEREGYEFRGTASNATAAEVLQNEYPEVDEAVRYGYKPETSFTYEDKRFTMDSVSYADENVFKVFTWPMIKGDPNSALSIPHTIVITEKIAGQCFSNVDPIGKILKFSEEETFVVTGVVKDVPDNSWIGFDALCSFKTLYTKETLKRILTDWLSHNFNTYLLLKEGVQPEDLEKKFPALLERFAGDEMRARGATESLFLHPLRQLYLNPPWTTRGPIFYVYIFSVVAGLVLLIACFNFMNLSTARSATRAHEVGVRKVLGASRKSLLGQFFSESLFFSFVSLLLAVALVQLILPAINSLTGRTLSLNMIELPWLLPGFIVLTLFVGFAAGSYPALLLSRFIPVKVLRGRMSSVKSNLKLRRGLVVLQFVISITLVICTVVIVRQLFFLQGMDAGFDKENVVVIPAQDDAIRKSREVIKEEFKKNPNISSVAASSTIPGGGYPNNMKIPEGFSESEAVLMDEINADHDFLLTMGIELLSGRNFSKEFGTDEMNSVIINETAVKQFGWEDPIGKTIKSFDPRKSDSQYKEMTVIGVVKDFHLRYLTHQMEPIFIGCDPDYPLPFNYLDVISVRFKSGDVAGTLGFLKKQWEKIFPSIPFEFYFLDEIFGSQFLQIERSRKIFSYFSFLAIFVACLGLYGMASFSAVQRTKEIGIRKVLGSTTTGIITLLGKELIGLILIANLVAWPLSFYAMNQWIQNYPYRVNIGIELFFASSLIVLIIGLLTISYQAVKAALANPVDSLRYE
jgi:putative ABC transport system permease protein